MTYLAFRNLFQQKFRLILSIGGVALAITLVILPLTIAPGEVVLIMGPSGSGKTTLLSMMGGLLKPSARRIQIGQDDLTRLDERRLPGVRLRRIGFIFKDIADRILWLEDGQFKDMVEMALDPVCGMSVDRQSAPAQATYDGQVFYFCARGCRDQFLEAPEQYFPGH